MTKALLIINPSLSLSLVSVEFHSSQSSSVQATLTPQKVYTVLRLMLRCLFGFQLLGKLDNPSLVWPCLHEFGEIR